MPGPLTATLEIKGGAELDAMLRKLPEDVAGPIMQAALAAAGDVVRLAIATNIHSRTGKTAADVRVQVQIHPEDNAGVAGIGGTRKGGDARGWVLRLLEFGARGKKKGGKGWDIVGGETDRRLARKAQRALRKTGNAAAAAAIREGLATGSITARRALKLPGNIFRARAHHPGFAGQSPMTRGLAESAGRVLDVFRRMLWEGIERSVAKERSVRPF
jgi:hypothetical protein